jgi:hypothetical protein
LALLGRKAEIISRVLLRHQGFIGLHHLNMRDTARFLTQASDQMEKRRGGFSHLAQLAERPGPQVLKNFGYTNNAIKVKAL